MFDTAKKVIEVKSVENIKLKKEMVELQSKLNDLQSGSPANNNIELTLLKKIMSHWLNDLMTYQK